MLLWNILKRVRPTWAIVIGPLYMFLQVAIINLMFRNLLPWGEMNVENHEFLSSVITFGFINTTFFLGYDFRIILFCNLPLFLAGQVGQGAALAEMVDHSEEEYNYFRDFVSALIFGASVTVAFYFKQQEQSTQIIDKDRSVKLNRQINDLFNSNQDGIVVYSMQGKTSTGEPLETEMQEGGNNQEQLKIEYSNTALNTLTQCDLSYYEKPFHLRSKTELQYSASGFEKF